jgi:hypothetical protein
VNVLHSRRRHARLAGERQIVGRKMPFRKVPFLDIL